MLYMATYPRKGYEFWDREVLFIASGDRSSAREIVREKLARMGISMVNCWTSSISCVDGYRINISIEKDPKGPYLWLVRYANIFSDKRDVTLVVGEDRFEVLDKVKNCYNRNYPWKPGYIKAIEKLDTIDGFPICVNGGN